MIKNDNCQKVLTCHKCGKKGRIKPNYSNTKSNKYGDNESDDKDKKNVHKKLDGKEKKQNKSI